MKHRETEIQKAVKKYLDAKGVLYNASCGGMRTNIRQAMVHKAMGAKKGFPDLFIYESRKGFCGLAIEVKAQNGVASDDQKEWRARLRANGYKAEICPRFKTDKECFEWAINIIDWYLE